MEKPNKALRHKIYKEALELYRNSHLTGLCHKLKHAASNLNKYDPYSELHIYFPEIAKHKPEGNTGWYWFPIEDTQSRIAILEQAIEETKRKVGTKKE